MQNHDQLAVSVDGGIVTGKVQVQLVDDIDNSPAEETLKFGLDGTSLQIDLNAEHAEQLRACLAR